MKHGRQPHGRRCLLLRRCSTALRNRDQGRTQLPADDIQEPGADRRAHQAWLIDGRTGEALRRAPDDHRLHALPRLHHLVDDKVHALHGPYSLVTQQPLGGKASSAASVRRIWRVWALEAYGAATMLEMLTVKVRRHCRGRTKGMYGEHRQGRTAPSKRACGDRSMCWSRKSRSLGLDIELGNS